MIKLKHSCLLLFFVLIFGCGGSSDGVPDYASFTDADMLALADQKKAQGDYENAIDHYNRLLLDFPTSNLHIQAQLKTAECYGAMDKWEKQFDTLNRLIRENIIPREVPQIYVQIGRFYERAAQFNPGVITTDSMDYFLATDYYDKALKYPDSDDNISKSESVYRRALVEAKIGKIDEAVARYKMVSNLFPTSEFSILAQMKLRDPNDVTELSLTDSAITRYKQVLGLLEKDDDFEEAVIEEKTDEQLESTIDALDQSTQEDMEEDEEENYYDEVDTTTDPDATESFDMEDESSGEDAPEIESDPLQDSTEEEIYDAEDEGDQGDQGDQENEETSSEDADDETPPEGIE